MLHIVRVLRVAPTAQAQWGRTTINVISTFREHLTGTLHFELDELWDFFAAVIDDNSVANIDANTRAPMITVAARLCKLVRGFSLVLFPLQLHVCDLVHGCTDAALLLLTACFFVVCKSVTAVNDGGHTCSARHSCRAAPLQRSGAACSQNLRSPYHHSV